MRSSQEVTIISIVYYENTFNESQLLHLLVFSLSSLSSSFNVYSNSDDIRLALMLTKKFEWF